MSASIQVISLFSGGGGLAEGFCPVGQNQTPYRLVLSAEKDLAACRTMRLRNFLRQFENNPLPEDYYKFLQGKISEAELLMAYPLEAKKSKTITWQTELGNQSVCSERALRYKIKKALGDSKHWVLIGGPPCQAYSAVGRSRNSIKPDYKPENDPRFHLYREYLKVLARNRPSAFVFENVSGILTAKENNKKLFPMILRDLTRPSASLRRAGFRAREVCYKLYSLTVGAVSEGEDPRAFIVRTEELGLPQTRHRVIVIGIRADIKGRPSPFKNGFEPATAGQVIYGLPRLRSGISKGRDGDEAWRDILREAVESDWLTSIANIGRGKLKKKILSSIQVACSNNLNRGGGFVPLSPSKPPWKGKWFHDPNVSGVINHHSKEHMPEDLHRYLFVAAYSYVLGRSPLIYQFPKQLLPTHVNALSGKFSDRFRAQHPDFPAKTITSHLARDGHYFIHPDPAQCRSLTVREAARLQTFPDNYLFMGNKTDQYTQVGNAVPPLLARIAAEQIFSALATPT